MITPAAALKLALAFDETIELPHFDRISFRVRNKIFATMLEQDNIAVLMLSPLDQSVFCSYDQKMMYPVPNKWGKKGATIVELKKVRRDLFKDALRAAYCSVAPKQLSEKYQAPYA